MCPLGAKGLCVGMLGFAKRLGLPPALRRAIAASILSVALIASAVAGSVPSYAAPSNIPLHGPVLDLIKPLIAKPTATSTGPGRANGPRFYDRKSLIDAADRYAIEVKGMDDTNRNGIPDYREFYVVDYHDCAEHSATFDWLLEEMAKDGWIDYEQGMGAQQIRGSGHAANIVPGLGEVDVTPVIMNGIATASDGTPWHHWNRGYTPYQQGFPDPGEFTFKGYNGPRAQTIPGTPVPGTAGLGGGGGGGLLGGASGLGFMAVLGQLLQGKGNSSSGGSGSKSTEPSKSGSKTPAKPTASSTAPKTPAPAAVPVAPAVAPVSPAPKPTAVAAPVAPAAPAASAVPQPPKASVPAGQSGSSASVPAPGVLQKAAADTFKNGSPAGGNASAATVSSGIDVAGQQGRSSAAAADVMPEAKRPSSWDIPVASAASSSSGAAQNSSSFF